MNYKCNECGCLIDRFEFSKKRYFVGEFWGVETYDYLYCCPKCGCEDSYAVKECAECHDWFGEEDLTFGLCKGCLNSATPKECFDIADNNMPKKSISLNEFIACMFEPKEIEEILLEIIIKSNIPLSHYIDEDKEWFAENLLKLREVKKNENGKN